MLKRQILLTTILLLDNKNRKFLESERYLIPRLTTDQEISLIISSFNENSFTPISESHSVKFVCKYLICICLGLFSSLKMELNFQRRSVYYLIQIYIPSGMIVVLSWVSVFFSIVPMKVKRDIKSTVTSNLFIYSVSIWRHHSHVGVPNQ